MDRRIFGSRGVQQEDVWSAADSLIAEGLRPTIERVRQKIGRGSPNTVTPMLESWFASLGKRLGINQSEEDSGDIPKILQQALKDAWELALSVSREESASEVAQAQTDLLQATAAVRQQEIELDQAEQVRAVKYQTLEQALMVAKNGIEEAFVRLSAAQALAGKYETQIEHLQAKLAFVETERDSERHRNQEITANYVFERQKIEERAQAMRRQMLEEIDRARQETKKLAGEAQASKKQFFAEKLLLEGKNSFYEKDLMKVQTLCALKSSELDALRQASTVSEWRALELQSMLKTQLADSTNAVARLTEALLNQATQLTKGPRVPARKVSRTIRTRKG